MITARADEREANSTARGAIHASRALRVTVRELLPFHRSYKGVREIMRNPGIAAILSFFIPGVGQIYNGKILRGIFWLIVTPGIWVGTGGWFGWVCHIISAFTAYRYAKRHPFYE